MDVFFYSLLAFSLVYFVGLVSQLSDIPLSSKSQIKKGFPQLATRGHSDQKKRLKNKKNIPIKAKCSLMGSLTVFENLNKSKMPIWIWKCLHRVHWSMGSVWFYFTLSRNEIFVFTWIFFSSYLSASQPQIVTQGSDELQERVVVTSNICTRSSEGNEVCI